eukprot:673900-Ditylum_brightwellii.AAC.5
MIQLVKQGVHQALEHQQAETAPEESRDEVEEHVNMMQKESGLGNSNQQNSHNNNSNSQNYNQTKGQNNYRQRQQSN